jgi:hypothetical protein
MKEEFFKWSLLTGLFVGALCSIAALSLYLGPLISVDDPYCLIRYLLLRLAAICVAAPALIGLMLFVDFITPSDWMKVIGDDPKASSYVMSAVILVIGAILCWT